MDARAGPAEAAARWGMGHWNWGCESPGPSNCPYHPSHNPSSSSALASGSLPAASLAPCAPALRSRLSTPDSFLTSRVAGGRGCVPGGRLG